MRKYYPDIRLFCWACGISLLGSLPPGTLNVSAASLAINKGLTAAAAFSLGAILIEMGMVRIAMFAVNKVAGLFFGLVSSLIIITFAVCSLYATFQVQQSAVLPVIGQQPFLSGLFLSLINPFHLPFWIGWTTVLKSRKILTDHYYVYLPAIGVGTALAFVAYIMAGSFLIGRFGEQQLIINRVVGIALLVTGGIQLYKSINSPTFVFIVNRITTILMTTKESFALHGENLLKKVKELIAEGNIRKVIITDKAGKEIMSFPLTFGVAGALLAPVFAAVGAAAALLGECTITVERDEEEPKKEA